MIIRILSEGQYELDNELLARLNEIDNRLVELVKAGTPSEFEAAFQELLTVVRSRGRRLADNELASSDFVIPAPDTTFDELRELFVADGLIAG